MKDSPYKFIGSVLLGVIMIFSTYELLTKDWSLIQNVNLIFHEAGHTIFSFGPQFLSVAMGSGFEILVPLLLSGYFLRKNQLLSSIFTLWWTGTALWATGRYASDALVRELPLLGGDAVIHDWFYLLLETKLLYRAETIGSLFNLAGSIFIGTSFILLFVYIYDMKKPKKNISLV